MRISEISRQTKETTITVKLNIDGSGVFKNESGCGFLDHMLDLFACHGRFDLDVSCKGDTEVDYHHSIEDIAIVLGQAFADALGDKAGIYRFANAIIPMDEALVMCAVDVCGRAHLEYVLDIPTEKVGDFDTELVEEFMSAFTRSLGLALHFQQFAGNNSHHIIEAAFKSLARALKKALSIDPTLKGQVPSTKGVL